MQKSKEKLCRRLKTQHRQNPLKKLYRHAIDGRQRRRSLQR